MPDLYRTIVADPPWPYAQDGMQSLKRDGSPDKGVGSHARYGSMAMADLCALRPPADANAHLFLWTTNAFMVEAHSLAGAWGFAPKTILTWAKMQHDGSGRVSMKSGYYFRGASEHVLFAVRGSLPLRDGGPWPTAYLWPRLPHSVKPDAFFDLVEECSPSPYLELFSRRARFGWDAWGDEALDPITLVAVSGKGEA